MADIPVGGAMMCDGYTITKLGRGLIWDPPENHPEDDDDEVTWVDEDGNEGAIYLRD